MWRKDILDELGYDIPTTLAEAEAVFEAYKSVYPTKFALTGRGKIDWQCFDLVFNAFGIVGGGQHVRDGKIVQFYATREFREALAVLQRWYGKGFWDTNFLNQNLEWINNFANGDYVVTQWANNDNWLYEEGKTTRFLEALRDIPGAVAVPATHLRADENTKPAQRTWNPYTGGMTAFGKQLENNRDKLHKIMQVIDLATDREVAYLAGFGIEGVHYTIPEGEEAPQLKQDIAALTEPERLDRYGFGFYWQPLSGLVIPLPARVQEAIDRFVLPPDAMYGINKVDRWQSPVLGPVTDETGEPVQVSTKTSWFQMAVDIMTGAQPLEYYDEWLQYYYDSGGREWERQATRLYLN